MHLLDCVRPDSNVGMLFSRFAAVLLGRQLVLNNNAIGDVGARALAGALAANRTLQVLLLQTNSIGGAGGAALAKALTVNRTLTNVCAGGSLATGEVAPRPVASLRVGDGVHIVCFACWHLRAAQSLS